MSAGVPGPFHDPALCCLDLGAVNFGRIIVPQVAPASWYAADRPRLVTLVLDVRRNRSVPTRDRHPRQPHTRFGARPLGAQPLAVLIGLVIRLDVDHLAAAILTDELVAALRLPHHLIDLFRALTTSGSR